MIDNGVQACDVRAMAGPRPHDSPEAGMRGYFRATLNAGKLLDRLPFQTNLTKSEVDILPQRVSAYQVTGGIVIAMMLLLLYWNAKRGFHMCPIKLSSCTFQGCLYIRSAVIQRSSA